MATLVQHPGSGRRRILRRLLLSGLLLMFACGFAATPDARAEPTAEYRIKAAFLFHFARFVQWPASSFADEQSPFVIGVLGADPFGSFLDDMVRGEQVEGRPVVVQRFNSAEEAAGSQILFVSRDADVRWRTISEEVAGRSVLTVADGEDATRHAGIIRFTTEAGKIRLAVAIDEARAANLSISSKLLRTARIIGRNQG